MLDCSAYHLWAQGRAGKRELKVAAEEMARLLERILRATGREADTDMNSEAWPTRNAIVAEERRYFLSNAWLPDTKQQEPLQVTALDAVVATAKTQPQTEAKMMAPEVDEEVVPPLTISEGVPQRAHTSQKQRPRQQHPNLDDHGRPVRNMYRDRSNRRLDLNDVVGVGAVELAERVPLVGAKLAADLVAYRASKAMCDGVVADQGVVVGLVPDGSCGGSSGGAMVRQQMRPIKSYLELLKKNGGVLPGDVGGKTFESLMCFTTL